MKTLAQAYAEFDLDQLIEQQLYGSAQYINAFDECCGRYIGQHKTALIWEGKHGQVEHYTFEQLDLRSAQLANFFKSQNIRVGDSIAGLLPRTPELLITILATWRIGAIYQPLFTAFESKAIQHRIETANTQLIVTHAEHLHKLNQLNLDSILVVDANNESNQNLPDFWTTLNRFESVCPVEYRTFEDDFLLMFTSGTTGLAKSVPVPLKAILAFKGYLQHAVDLRAEDAFWNLADPGWAYGLYYGITGPLSMGHRILLDEQPFSVDRAVTLLQKYQINNLTGSPTAFRMFFGFKEKFDAQIAQHLRVVSSAGEPLTPEVIHWFKEYLQVDIYDQYGQTELGMVIGNHHALQHEVKIGSAGFAIPGHRFAVLNEQLQELEKGGVGMLAIDWTQSPLMWFKGYAGTNRKSFKGNYYLTGDTVQLNELGGIDFVGRADDVITTSGYRVGPFDVESTLLECEEVLESAVIGKPDAARTEIVKAFVVLKPQHLASDALKEKLQMYFRGRLSKHAYPKEIEFMAALPKTVSGKIQRGVLKQQEIDKMQMHALIS
ncbi:AMP-binding protein [Acinetobacter soli]|uniref:AMP-binding protein n=1 Tax=Acinetobacter soli TaxID=487316 RepID=UPI00124F84B7|nr:AMP-binding protein [Acinetobacter soli]